MKFSYALSIKMIVLGSTTLIGANPVKESSNTVTIENNTNQTLNLNLPIPAQTIAFIQMKKLGKSQQELQDMLHAAILKDSAEEIEQAVQAGANMKDGKDGKSPLLWAVLLKKTTAVETLLRNGAIVDKTMVQNAIDLRTFRTACLLAIEGNLDAINDWYFYDNQRKNRATLLHVLIMNHDFESAYYLALKRPELIGNVGNYDSLVKEIATKFAINSPTATKLLQAIISRGYNVNNIWTLCSTDKRTSLVNAIYNPDVLGLFLAAHANPNIVIDINKPHRISRGIWTITPLLKAIDLRNTEAVRLLINAGANVNQRGNVHSDQKPSTPLALAIQKGATDIVALLLEHGASL